MQIKKAEFVISNSDYTKCPETTLPEYAFIGRSNVGKSSLINMVTDRTKLAKTSGKPGKTQLINHFMINKEWYLVDLPGYGWAQVSKTDKAKFNKMTKDYLTTRSNLVNIFILIDSRIPPQKIDLEFIQWTGENGLPLSIIFTKADKPNNNKTKANIATFNSTLKETWDELPPTFITSSSTKFGQKEILDYIENINKSI
ncbi:MAG: ribosome biogenesis GTP-binding protein YihA/YsxC [Reichenbachiella sp.]